MRKNIRIYLAEAVLVLAGLAVMVTGLVLLFRYNSLRSSSVRLTAEISDIETYSASHENVSHRAYVTFQCDGKTYENVPLSEYNSAMKVGGEVTVYFNPDNPAQAYTDFHLDGLPLLLLGVGLLFVLAGLVPVFVFLHSKLKKNRLMDVGKKVTAVVDRIDLNYGFSTDGRHPYVVICRYDEDGTTYLFKSRDLWEDPSAAFPVGSEIDVYVDRRKYSRHYVDVDNVAAKAEDFT